MRIYLFAITTIFLISSVHAIAAEPRTIDFTVVLKDQDESPFDECADFSDRECKIKRPLTLGSAALRSLSLPEQGMDQAESLKRGKLALSVYKSQASQLTAEEISLIKKQMPKAYTPLVVVRAFAILDPADSK